MPIEFESDKFKDIRSFQNDPKGYIGFLIKMGFAKDEAQAGKILIFVSFSCIIVAILVPIIFL